ncbi:DNA internalization-related competence protein ComEC/Rec2 [bacterium]|nr:DNA internalization-related competence protein ComEC/Rec2 [bacterium]
MVHAKPALIASLFLIGGIVLALYSDVSLSAALIMSFGVLLVCGALFLFRAPSGILLSVLAVLVIAVGFVRGIESIGRSERNTVAQFASTHKKTAVLGRLVRAETQRGSRGRLLLSQSALISQGDTLKLRSLRIETRGSVSPDTLQVGDWILTGGTLRLPEDTRVPGQVGLVRQAVMERVAAYVYTGDDAVYITVPSQTKSLSRLIHSLRQKIVNALDDNLSEKASALCKALLLGDRSGFSQEFNDQVKLTGLSHIFALSGLNVGLVASLVWLFAIMLGLPFNLRLWLCLLSVFFYVALGLGIPSLMRAGIMCSVFLVGHLLHRKAQPLNIVGTAAFLELLWRPMDLVDIGFQLSYLAVLGMVLTYIWLKAVTAKIFSYKFVSRPAIRSTLDVGFATFGAQIGTLPLLAAVFGTIPFIGLLANLVAVPAFAVLLWWEILFLAVVPVSHTIAASVGASINAFSEALHIFVEWFSAIPGASLRLGYLSPIALAGVYLGLGIAWGQLKNFSWKRASIGALIVLNALVWPQVFQWKAARFEIYVLDVGTGDAILLRSPQGKAMLIDTGPAYGFWDASWRILPAMKSIGVERLDAMVLTHAEMDHIGGAEAIITQFPVQAVYMNGIPRTTHLYQKLIAEMSDQGLANNRLEAGDILTALYPFPIRVLSPDSIWRSQGDNQNQRSLVLRVDIGETSALFAADIDSLTEKRLLVWGDMLQGELLKLPHHGSKTSNSREFLEAANPQIAAITAGRHNPHGHPSDIVIERLDRLGIPYRITGEEGTLLWTSDGKTLQEASWRRSTLAEQWHLPTIDTTG